MTVPEALGMVRQVGAVEIHGENLRVKFPEKDRARLQPALYTLRKCKAEALAILATAKTSAPDPPENDWDRGELELLSGIEDDAAREELITFKNTLSGALSPAGRIGKFVSAAQYQKDMLATLFVERRKQRARQYAGLALREKETLARQAARAEKEERGALWDEQRQIQKGWAKWARLHAVVPAVADRYRAEHESQDPNWLLKLAPLKAVYGVRIPSELKARVVATGEVVPEPYITMTPPLDSWVSIAVPAAPRDEDYWAEAQPLLDLLAVCEQCHSGITEMDRKGN
jgi:hypothetical protein